MLTHPTSNVTVSDIIFREAVVHPESVDKVDGRVERTNATRTNILAVTRALILAGNLDPTAREVAESAGITTRTLFRHFPDVASLHQSFIEEAEAGAAVVMDEPFPEASDDDWRQLLEVVIERRVRVYESLYPLYISTIWSRLRAVQPAKQRQGVKRRRARLRQILPARIGQDSALFEALDGLLSIEYWISLRRDQRLGIAASTEVVRLAVRKLTER